MNTLAGLADALLLAQGLRTMSPQPVRGVASTGPLARAGSDFRAPAPPAHGTGNTPAAPTTASSAGGGQAMLSSTARLLGEVLGPLPASPGPVTGAKPLMAGSPADAPGAMAARLSEAVSTSGLFYESHLAGLADGSLPPSALMREPQARWGEPRSWQQAPDAEPAARDDDSPAHRADARTAQRHADLPPHARTIVAQQLELLAAGVFRWQGEAWPGVPMAWSVHEESEQTAPPGEAVPRWSATVSLVLPQLGRVDLRLALAGQCLGVSVEAGEAAAARLRDATEELRARLAAAGFEKPQLAVTVADR